METNTILICLAVGAVIALIVALIGGAMDKSKMITVRKAAEASHYTDGNIHLSVRMDNFSHQSQRVIHHEQPKPANSQN